MGYEGLWPCPQLFFCSWYHAMLFLPSRTLSLYNNKPQINPSVFNFLLTMMFYYRNRRVTNTQINPHIIISSPKLKLLILFGEGLTPVSLHLLKSWWCSDFHEGPSLLTMFWMMPAPIKYPRGWMPWHFLTLPLHLSIVVLRCQEHCILQVHLHVFSCSLILLFQFLLFISTEAFRHLFSLCFLLKTWPSLIKIPWHLVDHGVHSADVP